MPHNPPSPPYPGLSETGFDLLRRRLVDLVEPLNDGQLLALADGIHEMLRQRRVVRQNHAERLKRRTGESGQDSDVEDGRAPEQPGA